MDIKRPLLTALGKHLRSKRRKRGKSLRTLSEEMGLSKGNISNIELGLRDPRFSTLAAMAASLGFTVSTLLEDFKPTEKQLDQILERRTKKLK